MDEITVKCSFRPLDVTPHQTPRSGESGSLRIRVLEQVPVLETAVSNRSPSPDRRKLSSPSLLLSQTKGILSFKFQCLGRMGRYPYQPLKDFMPVSDSPQHGRHSRLPPRRRDEGCEDQGLFAFQVPFSDLSSPGRVSGP
ncbi:hypothetical protein J6590_044078 [Homalodisca vitripennis]|nr:hypothetical protein J6590_044078 [Homalodisca vitripennis]